MFNIFISVLYLLFLIVAMVCVFKVVKHGYSMFHEVSSKYERVTNFVPWLMFFPDFYTKEGKKHYKYFTVYLVFALISTGALKLLSDYLNIN